MASSIRDALEEAFTDLDAGEVEAPEAPAPIADEPVADLAPVKRESAKTEERYAPEFKDEDPAPAPAKEKHVIKDGKRVTVKPATQEPFADKAQKTPPVQAATHRPPQSWKPEVREHFSRLPPQVQEEITRRENDIQRELKNNANTRKFAQDFGQMIRPFEALIAGSGVTSHLQAVNNVMRTAAVMQTGTQAQKATTVANMIKAYGVDIRVLDGILAGRAPAQGQGQGQGGGAPSPDIERMLEQRLKPFQEFMGQVSSQQRYQEQQLAQESEQSIADFAQDPKNQYFEDLREDMADILDMAAKRKQVVSIQEAYERAAALHPTISKLVSKAKAAEAAVARRGNIDRARRAAVSQSSGIPASVGKSGAKPTDRRGALSAAWDDLSSA